MKKRFRDEKGKLTCTVQELNRATATEAAQYFQIGKIYLDHSDGEEYVLTEISDGLALFESFGSKKTFRPLESLGSFLPDVASVGMELELVEC